MNNTRLIVVLGMHRSGTSVITRGLKVMGVELGDKLMRSVERNNPKGFWEDVDIYELNNEMLSVLNIDWHCLTQIENCDVKTLREKGYFLRAVELLCQKAGDASIFGFKDPRVTKLLPFWKEVFSQIQLDVSYVLAMRNPMNVAESLLKRDGFDMEKSYLLWLGHILSILMGITNGKRLFVNYDWLMQSPDHELNRIAKCLQLEIVKEELQIYKAEFLSKELWHKAFDLDDLLMDDACPPVVAEMYAALLDVASDKTQIHDPVFQNKITHWVSEFERLKSSLMLAERDIALSERDIALSERDIALSERDIALSERDADIAGLTQAVFAYQNSKSWKITAPLREFKRQKLKLDGIVSIISKRIIALWRIRQRVGTFRVVYRALRVLMNEGPRGILHRICLEGTYIEWIKKYDFITDKNRENFKRAILELETKIQISIVMPVYNPSVELLNSAIQSVRSQLYPYWELCIADDYSTNPGVKDALEKHANEDERIKVVFREKNGHISEASNSALELATGDFVALLDHDDMLSEHALYWVVKEINDHPDAKIIYSDEDKIELNDIRHQPYFKCDWNFDLFLSRNLFNHLCVYKTDLVKSVGGFRKGIEGAQDYDLALRCLDQIDFSQIYHIPRILYHWRVLEGSTALDTDEKPYAMLAGERAINEYLSRNKIAAKAKLTSGEWGYWYRVSYEIPEPFPLVSLIIPTKNGVELLRKCINSIIGKTLYSNYEIIIIDNSSDEQETLEYLESVHTTPNITVIRDDGPFNFSALNNKAVKNTTGNIIGLINDDVEVISPEWLGEMVSLVTRPEVGIVGARLWYPDDTLQHGGIILGIGGVAGHSHKKLPKGHPGYYGRAELLQSYSAVTAACLLVRKEVYMEVGGMDEQDLSIAFNDVDFCLRVRDKGYRVLWTPYAELYHYESASRGYEDTQEKQMRFRGEIECIQKRWGHILKNDPAYNPNLTLEKEDFSYAFPPRVKHIL